MSSFAAPPVNSNLKQPKVEAEALSTEGEHEQAYLLYQQVYKRLLVTHDEDHSESVIIMYIMGVSLLQLHRFVEAHSIFEKVLPKLVSVRGDQHPLTLRGMSCMAG
jgi:hypothetical protein